MKTYLNQTELDKLLRKEVRENGKTGISELLEEKRVINAPYKSTKTIFLCHAHIDKTIVEKIVILFNKIDASVYVDWMDEAMPKVTDRSTAQLIKEKINHCHKFLFLGTSRGIESKWCVWEAGIAYSLKEEKDIALAPVKSKSGNWRGNEYLDLYPIMRFHHDDLDNIRPDQVEICRPDKTSILLQKWLLS